MDSSVTLLILNVLRRSNTF